MCGIDTYEYLCVCRFHELCILFACVHVIRDVLLWVCLRAPDLLETARCLQCSELSTLTSIAKPIVHTRFQDPPTCAKPALASDGHGPWALERGVPVRDKPGTWACACLETTTYFMSGFAVFLVSDSTYTTQYSLTVESSDIHK